MRVLVTGGGGFLGRSLVEQLLARGDRVRVFSRQRYADLDALGVESRTGDLQDEAVVTAACAGVDVVFHAAALPGIWGLWKLFHGVNTLGTQHVIEGCRQHGVGKLVFTSSPSVVYDGHDHRGADESLPYATKFLCHYSRSKALAEQVVLAANGQGGLATCALRPHLMWGPRDTQLIPRLLERAKTGRLLRVGDGKNLISMIYVENAAHAHLQAADALSLSSPVAGQAYFINEPEPVNLWDWINTLLARAGLPPVTKGISAGAASTIGAVLELVYGLCGVRSEPRMTRFLASQLSRSHWYRVEKAQRDFGFAPLVSVEEGLRRLEPELRGRRV
ncbi:MAG TPA: NAD-dependent epimerase/dehydratase family protein [Planctomycetaceae bacterium]|nr:NAD-dependent epimerase/dehydratase family protein [Planctomycetaceae bacterium]